MDFSALNPRSTNTVSFAARGNDVDTLKSLLKSGRSPNYVDNRGWTALHEAAASDSFEALEILLKHRETLTLAETFEGQSALYLACRNRSSMKIINLLLNSVENIVDYASNEMVSPLHVVCSQGRGEAVEALVRAGAMLDFQDFDGDSPLHEAAQGGHSQICAALLHAGADSGLRNSHGLTPFLIACFKGSIETVIEIFPFVTEVNDCTFDGNTGLILATQRGSLDVARFLLANDANPDILNNEGALPLYMALMHGHAKLFQLLLPVTDVNKINRNLMNFACKPLYFSMDIIITILESDLGPEFFNKCDRFHVILENIFGRRPCYTVNPPLCSILNVMEYIYNSSGGLCGTLLLLLLSKGVAVNALYKEECPPLVYLHYCEHIKCYHQVIDILISQGCNVDYTTAPPDKKMVFPDALIASITSSGHTLPMLLTYSLKQDPEQIMECLVEHNFIGQRISAEVVLKILPMCCLSRKTLEAMHQQLLPYLQSEQSSGSSDLLDMLKFKAPSLKHLCRRVIRLRLRKRVTSTPNFLNVLKRLPLPPTLKLYLRFS